MCYRWIEKLAVILNFDPPVHRFDLIHLTCLIGVQLYPFLEMSSNGRTFSVDFSRVFMSHSLARIHKMILLL